MTGKEKMSKSRKILRILSRLLLPVLIIGLGVFIFILLVKFRQEPEKVDVEPAAPLVTVKELEAENKQMVISGYGTVQPKLKVEIVPQVSGKVVWVNPDFREGGFIPAGEKLFEIDKRDYELAVQEAQAAVAEARVKLELEQAEGKVALQEWEQINPGEEPESPLVFREPQIKQAKAQVESAKAKLRKAELELSRTDLNLPENVRITSENVDLGQFVVAGRSYGNAYGAGAVEIPLPLEDDELEWFSVPSVLGGDSDEKGSPAKVINYFAGGKHVWQGYVDRADAEINEESRMVTVYIEVPDAFERINGKPLLLPGTFVEVEITGKNVGKVVAVPRDAVKNGDQIWVANEGHLRIKDIEILRSDKDFAYVKNGSIDGSLVVLSSLDTVVEGMKIRPERIEGNIASSSEKEAGAQ